MGFLSVTLKSSPPHLDIILRGIPHLKKSAALSSCWLLPDEDFSRRARNPDFYIKLQILKRWLRLKEYVQAKQNTRGGQVQPIDSLFSTPDLPLTVVVRTELTIFKIRSVIIITNTHIALNMMARHHSACFTNLVLICNQVLQQPYGEM